ncbi:MAG TPA: ABC transporter permease subunit [Acidimicrobiales bacterium]|nr:ABC transporter permease subunit [Acidimicrobiales bacterium]
MTWLVWRQARAQTAVALGGLVVLAVIFVMTGPHIVHAFRNLVASCASHDLQSCNDASANPVTSDYRNLQVVAQVLVLVVPALVAMFWGAPLIARELETGTYRLAWTQSVTRRHWVLAKVGLVGLATIAASGLLSLMVTWWFSPIDALNASNFSLLQFSVRGIAPLGYGAFAFALGVLLGVVLRHTLAAMAATLGGFVFVRLAFTYWIRQHLLPTSHLTVPVTPADMGFAITPSGAQVVATAGNSIPNSWVYSASIVNRAGQAPDSAFVKTACPSLASGFPGVSFRPGPAAHGALGSVRAVPVAKGDFVACAHKVAESYHEVLTYQPPSHYWPMQGIETGVFLAAAAGLLALALWFVRTRVS